MQNRASLAGLSTVAGLLAMAATPAVGQDLDDAVMQGLRSRFEVVSDELLTAAEQVPADQYDYRPSEEVRTMGEIFLHVATAQFAYCGAVTGQAMPASARGEATEKAQIVARVRASRDFCLPAYADTSDDALAETIDVFGTPDTRVGTLIQNLAHDNLHYGNIVTYMRAIGMVPPSSQPPAQ